MSIPPPMNLTRSMVPPMDIYNPQIGRCCYGQPSVFPSDPTVRFNGSYYYSNLWGALEGTYITDTPAAEKVQIMIAAKNGHEYAVVRRVYTGMEVVPDQLIFRENNCFKLCSLEGYVLAVMMNEIIVKSSLT